MSHFFGVKKFLFIDATVARDVIKKDFFRLFRQSEDEINKYSLEDLTKAVSWILGVRSRNIKVVCYKDRLDFPWDYTLYNEHMCVLCGDLFSDSEGTYKHIKQKHDIPESDPFILYDYIAPLYCQKTEVRSIKIESKIYCPISH